MATRLGIEKHLSELGRQARERALAHGYATDDGMPAGIGFRKCDCNLAIVSLGHFLGFKALGRQDWSTVTLDGHSNPVVDGGEIAMAYPGTDRGHSDYAWVDESNDVVAIFEVDGRDNSPTSHLPVDPTDPRRRQIQQHIKPGARKNSATNNLFKLSRPVATKQLGKIPSLRCWVLYQVNGPPKIATKGAWGCQPSDWRNYFGRCPALHGALAVGDWELYEEVFVEAVCDAFGIA